jgi:hypothetical protein
VVHDRGMYPQLAAPTAFRIRASALRGRTRSLDQGGRRSSARGLPPLKSVSPKSRELELILRESR